MREVPNGACGRRQKKYVQFPPILSELQVETIRADYGRGSSFESRKRIGAMEDEDKLGTCRMILSLTPNCFGPEHVNARSPSSPLNSGAGHED